MYRPTPFQASHDSLQALLTHALKQLPFRQQSLWQLRSFEPVSGGDISQAFRLFTDGPSFFIKIHDSAKLPLFRAEQHCLKELLKTHTLRTPRPFGCGHQGEYAYLLMEGLDLDNHGDWQLAGQQLAELHQVNVGQRYGFDTETFCGRSGQPNEWEENWGHFFAVKRLGQQLMRFHCNDLHSTEVSHTVDAVRLRLRDHQPQPAFVHGDLWHGNLAFNQGLPVFFDPASYCGDRETDIAMSELFGRLPEAFYQGYLSRYPLDPGYPSRRPLYQLYHLLNHANLFGGSYRTQAEHALGQLNLGGPA